jgi:hypothetical protein
MPISRQHSAIKQLMEDMNIGSMSTDMSREEDIKPLGWFSNPSDNQLMGYTLWGIRRFFYNCGRRHPESCDWKNMPFYINRLMINPQQSSMIDAYQEWGYVQHRGIVPWSRGLKEEAVFVDNKLKDYPNYMNSSFGYNNLSVSVGTYGVMAMWSDSPEHPMVTEETTEDVYYRHYRDNIVGDSYWFDAHTPPMRRTMNFVSIIGKAQQRMMWVKYHNDNSIELNIDNDSILATDVGNIIACSYNAVTQPVLAPNGLLMTIRKPERKDNVTTTN